MMTNPARAIKRRYFVDGRWLEALQIDGPNTGVPTIVMLHEGLGSIAHWKNFPFLLAEATDGRIFVYSRYGHGGSDPLREPRSVSYMHHEAQVVLREILEKAGIERPVLFGHSDGASIALLYAGMFPDSPAALILEAPHVFVEDLTLTSIRRARALYQETGLRHNLGRYHADVDSLFWGWNNAWLEAAFKEWNIESFLDHIRCPVLLLQGAQDEYGTTKQVDAIQRRIPAASAIVFEACRHAPHRDQCEATLRAVVEFLGTVRIS